MQKTVTFHSLSYLLKTFSNTKLSCHLYLLSQSAPQFPLAPISSLISPAVTWASPLIFLLPCQFVMLCCCVLHLLIGYFCLPWTLNSCLLLTGCRCLYWIAFWFLPLPASPSQKRLYRFLVIKCICLASVVCIWVLSCVPVTLHSTVMTSFPFL